MLDVFDDDLEIDQDFLCHAVTQNTDRGNKSGSSTLCLHSTSKPSSAKRSRLSSHEPPKSKLKKFTFVKNNFDDKHVDKHEIRKEPSRLLSVQKVVEVSETAKHKEDHFDIDFDSFFADDDFDSFDNDLRVVTAPSVHPRCDRAASPLNISSTRTNVADLQAQEKSIVNAAKEVPKSLVPTCVKDSVSIFARKTVTRDTNSTPLSRRKFPGPAGLLPKVDLNRQMEASNTFADAADGKNDCRAAKDAAVGSNLDVSCSQASEDDFNSGPWLAMVNDLSRECSGQPAQILSKFSIVSVLEQASGRKFSRGKKVPLLFVMLHSKFNVNSGFIAVFKDQTGKITANVCRTLIDDYEEQLKPGCTLVLKQVVIFSPSSKKHYLTVTASNVAHIYSKNSKERVEHLSISTDSWESLLNQKNDSPPALVSGRAIARSETTSTRMQRDNVDCGGEPDPNNRPCFALAGESLHEPQSAISMDLSDDSLWADDDFESVLRDLNVDV